MAFTASRASSAFCTMGTSRVCAPISSSCLICTGSFHEGVPPAGWGRSDRLQLGQYRLPLFGACSPSISSQSNLALASSSAL